MTRSQGPAFGLGSALLLHDTAGHGGHCVTTIPFLARETGVVRRHATSQARDPGPAPVLICGGRTKGLVSGMCTRVVADGARQPEVGSVPRIFV